MFLVSSFDITCLGLCYVYECHTHIVMMDAHCRQGSQKSEGEIPKEGSTKDGSQQGLSPDKSLQNKGPQLNTSSTGQNKTTSKTGQNKPTTKKPGKPATGSIMDVKIRGGSGSDTVNQAADKAKVPQGPESGPKVNMSQGLLGSGGMKGGGRNATATKGKATLTYKNTK
jgi:hypothetical protein